jgi:O-antigen biosynthesis protein
MERKLKHIFTQHKGKLSDQWSLYINAWDDIFSPYQNREISLLEIGTQNGGSLEIFAKYFPQAKHIIGCDIEENCQALEFSDPRITVITGDINSDTVENRIAELAPDLDIIIDDGSHHPRDIIRSFCRHFKRLDDHGLYLIEDLHTSYWGDYDGGLYQPYTAIAFLKRLVDITNFEHWQNHQSRQEHLSPFTTYYDIDFDEFDFHQIHAIEFVNSLCVIHKRPPEENSLGKRMIVGSEEGVSNGYSKFNGTTIHDIPKDAIDDTHLDVFALIGHSKELEAKLSQQEQTIHQLNDNATKQERTIQMLKSEVSQKEQTLQQLKLAIAENEQTLQQLEKDRIEQKLFIKNMNAQISEQSQAIVDLTAEIRQQNHIIHQLQNDVTAGEQQIHEYHHRIAALNQQVSDLQNEILFYALSKSWRFTRPLRKFMRLLGGKRHV